jgi:hypothetical protein
MVFAVKRSGWLLPADQAVGWLRHNHHHRAVETPWQRWWLCGGGQVRSRGQTDRADGENRRAGQPERPLTLLT